MPFDLTANHEVGQLRHEISQLVERDSVRERLDAFSYWKIGPGTNGRKKYRILRHGAAGFSDMQGHYLCNLVLQGGGTLGLAHAGFIVGLETAGFRFPGVAGTSAGAIIASGLFALRDEDILKPVGNKLTEFVRNVPMDTFVDGPRTIRRILKRFAAGRSIKGLRFWSGLVAAKTRLLRSRGLNSGQVFEDWMREVFQDCGLTSVNDLVQRADGIARDLFEATCPSGPHPFRVKRGAEVQMLRGVDILKMITVAMPTASKFCLPRDMRYLDDDYRSMSPARLIRMSMSIPLFFEPCVMKTKPEAWQRYVREEIADFVSDRAAWEYEELRKLVFLDGGLFSNLPTDELVSAMSAELASISVPLVATRKRLPFQNTNTLSALVSDAGDVFNAVKLQRDREAHNRMKKGADTDGRLRKGLAEERHRRVLKIDTRDANWLNFTMPHDEKEALYLAGLRRARDFIRTGA